MPSRKKHGLLIGLIVVALFFTAECGESDYIMCIIDACHLFMTDKTQ